MASLLINGSMLGHALIFFKSFPALSYDPDAGESPIQHDGSPD
jgi:hypothetical protein